MCYTTNKIFTIIQLWQNCSVWLMQHSPRNLFLCIYIVSSILCIHKLSTINNSRYLTRNEFSRVLLYIHIHPALAQAFSPETDYSWSPLYPIVVLEILPTEMFSKMVSWKTINLEDIFFLFSICILLLPKFYKEMRVLPLY